MTAFNQVREACGRIRTNPLDLTRHSDQLCRRTPEAGVRDTSEGRGAPHARGLPTLLVLAEDSQDRSEARWISAWPSRRGSAPAPSQLIADTPPK